MKQIISRIIQVCLISMAVFWIFSSSFMQSLIESFPNGLDDCNCEYMNSPEQKDSIFKKMVFDIENKKATVDTHIKNSTFNAEIYFTHIKYLDSIGKTIIKRRVICGQRLPLFNQT